jgi:tetratricopeptide (TPR) repeat protein
MMAETDFEKAEKLFKQEKWELAKPLFENHLKENPGDLKTIEYLGDIAGHLKNWDNCIYYYNKLKTIKPTEANFWYKYGGGLGMKASQKKSLESLKMVYKAQEAFEKAIAISPMHIDARHALVTLYLRLPGIFGGSETKAKKYAEELQELSKVDGYLAKGYIDEYSERYTKAEANYIKAHEIGNSKITFQKLYNLYLTKIKDKTKAKRLKEQFEK